MGQVAPTDAAWAAGFFDGEGCTTGVNRPGGKIARVSIGQVDPRVLLKFQEIFKCGYVRGPYKRKKVKHSKHSPIYNYNISCYQDIVFVLRCLWPYLSQVKKKQALKYVPALRKKASYRNGIETHNNIMAI